MRNRPRHAGIKTICALTAIAVGAGLLTAAVTLPVVGAVGLTVSDISKAFNDMPVAGLGQVPSKSELLDESGHVIATYYPSHIYRDPVHWHQIAPVMRNAVVAIEDYRFWQHGAFDLHGTLRALTATASGGDVQGGSDIAQQYVKNACVLTAVTAAAKLACAAHSVVRKLRELRIAINVMHEMTRPQLLVAYLNAAFYGEQAYGIKVAAGVYFQVPPSQLTLTQAALLAGIINSPTHYDPLINPRYALGRRTEVLNAMAAHGYISQATANQAIKQPLGLHPSVAPESTGCTAAGVAGFFCDYVMHVMAQDPAYATAYHDLLTVGGLKIYTTLNPRYQQTATNAVDYVLPAGNNYFNPNRDVDTEVLIQPGTGYVRAIAVNRPFGYQPSLGQDSIDYAVNSQYNGGAGVQTGSSSKLFTLLTALKQGVPFGFSMHVVSPANVTPYYSCDGGFIPTYSLGNAEGPGKGTFTLYNGTTGSINVFYAKLEQRVGLCNVVKTAASLGMTRADGTSLLRRDPHLPAGNNFSADHYPSFTLGSIYVSPMSMAAAYATVAARGIYCHPLAITMITDARGKQLPVEQKSCHRVLSTSVADAANFILQGVLTSGTAAGRGIGVPAAAKTGTSDGGYYAAFAGYTPVLTGYVSVFNPYHPTGSGAMLYPPHTCYREINTNYPSCPGQMFGDNAPGATWELTFSHLHLPAVSFVAVPPNSPFLSLGNGFNSPQPSKKKKGHH